MATIDVEVRTTIARPRAVVAVYCCDPDNATSWYANIDSVRWGTPRPMGVGSRFTFGARFLGRPLNYTYEWEDAPDGTTPMRLRNRGEPAGFSLRGSCRSTSLPTRFSQASIRLSAVTEGFEPPDGFSRLSLSRRVH
jgi:hypothetical protein